MAQLIGLNGTVTYGDTTDLYDSVDEIAVGTRARDTSGNEYVFMLGVASTAAYSVVTYDESFVTTLIAANAVGGVAIAQAAVVADTYGWYLVKGTGSAKAATTVVADLPAYIDGTAGQIDDDVVSGDLVYGMIIRSTTSGGLATVQLVFEPYVNNT